MEQFPVQHLGEFVLTSGGSIDFGEISEETARQIRRQMGKIRLRIGFHSDDAKESGRNYGELHIEREGRLRQLQRAGFATARDFVEYVGKNYTAIYDGNGGTLKLCARARQDFTMFVKLVPSAGGDFYDVQTAMVTRKSYLQKETPLWKSPQAEPSR